MNKNGEMVLKTAEEQIAELARVLRLLKSALMKVASGSEDETLIVWGLLRLLICDRTSGAEGGLLIRLIKDAKYSGLMKLQSAEVPLDLWKNQQSFKMSIGDSNNVEYSLTRCELINNLAQNEGIAHSSSKRHRTHADFMTVLSISKSDKTNLTIGAALQWGSEILEFGKKFLTDGVKSPAL